MTPTLQLDKARFLARYWQREALFLPAAVAHCYCALDADELAGLAMEESVESRIITGKGDQWSQRHGPFKEEELQQAGSWTLLVQAVDHYIESVAGLRCLVDFIPQWRMDDIMVSYSTDGASVGPHYDNYDVFLLQGQGQKLWKVGQRCTPAEPLVPHDELRILQQFDCQQEYLLGPGDVLYVPPGVAHWGIAVGESTTFSIGFRAPRVADMAARWLDNTLARPATDTFFSDPARRQCHSPGEISQTDLRRACQQLRAALDDETCANLWFGELVTEPRYDMMPTEDEVQASIEALQAQRPRVNRVAGSKLAWSALPASIAVYSNGHAAIFDPNQLAYLKLLCTQDHVTMDSNDSSEARSGSGDLNAFLVRTGSVYVD